MSVWYQIKDGDDVELSEDGKTLDICFLEDHNGGNYIEIPVEFIKKAVLNYFSAPDNMVELKKEFDATIPKMLNEGIVDIGDKYETELIVGGKVIERLWQWFEDRINNECVDYKSIIKQLSETTTDRENIILELKAENEKLKDLSDAIETAKEVAIKTIEECQKIVAKHEHKNQAITEMEKLKKIKQILEGG